jgi:hypothetical protein
MMIIGFTGTSEGLTAFSKVSLKTKLEELFAHGSQEFHHGDCIGADATAHDYAKQIGYKITVHPPVNPRKRAFKQGDLILSEQPYLLRNKVIVDSCHILIAAPAEMNELIRSGTWSTWRYARKMGRPILLIKPDGRTINQ